MHNIIYSHRFKYEREDIDFRMYCVPRTVFFPHSILCVVVRLLLLLILFLCAHFHITQSIKGHKWRTHAISGWIDAVQRQQQQKCVHRNVCDSSLIFTPRTILVIVLWIPCDVYSVLCHWHGTNAVCNSTRTLIESIGSRESASGKVQEGESVCECVSIMQSSVCMLRLSYLCVWVILYARMT